MANTRRINEIVEPYVRNWLSGKYGGRKFCSKQLPLKSGRSNEFDAVSEDRAIIAAILSNRARTRGGKSNSGARNKAERDFWRLANLDMPKKTRKLMVFTDAELRDDMEKIIGEPERLGVELLTCKLPRKQASELAAVLDIASREQRARGD